MGLHFGLYTDISGHSCSFNPNIGSQGSYSLDAQSFADWGADYVKVDYCGYGARFSTGMISLEDAIAFHAFAPLETLAMRVTNAIPLLGCSLTLPVGTANCVETLQVLQQSTVC
jgi:hypothetical protein